MKGDAGKWAEKSVQDWLSIRSDADSRFAFHRFPDARSARGALAAQPSDNLVIHRGTVTFLEVKESAEKVRLPRSKVSQYGALMKMSWAGARVAVIVHRSTYKDWLVLKNEHLFFNETPTSFPFLNHPTYPTAAAALEELFA
jgi:hypothetical protein